MRKFVVLLVFGVVAPGVIVALAGCGPSAPRSQEAAPTKTAAPLQEATATAPYSPDPSPSPSLVPTAEAAVAASNTPDVPSTPTPVPTVDDDLEFASANSLKLSGKVGGITGVEQVASKKSGPPAEPAQGQTFTWEDGDRTLTVYLQTDLVVEKGSGGLPRDIVAADDRVTNVVGKADSGSKDDTLPVFRAESGSLMTLPGGVLLVLSAEWNQAETNAFFSNNGIKMDRVSELGYVANGFFIETEPGFSSLDLANELSALNGVEVSSPNWGRDAVPK